MPFCRFDVNYINPLIIGRHIDTGQSYETSIGFPIIINDFAQFTFEYNKNLYKFGKLCFLLTKNFVCVDNLVWLYKHSCSRSEKSKIAKILPPGTCVLQCYLRGKVRMGKGCFRARKLWVGVTSGKLYN